MRRLTWKKSGLLALLVGLSGYLCGQQTPDAVQGQKPQEASSQVQTTGVPGNPLPANATPQTGSQKAERLAPPHRSQAFEFTKVDLELLKQVNAFDVYMEEKGLVYNDPDTNAYLEKLGMSLVPAETPENVTWKFRAVRDLEVNAFALPNGSIYVNSGLLSRMENEAQVAGVLAHEVTHVANRHSYLEYRSARKKMVAIDIMLAAASAAAYAGVNPGITNAMGNVLPLIVISTIFGYSREMEHEADEYAVNTLQVEGYDLREFSRGFELLRKGPEVDLSKEPVFWASHPKLADRVQFVAEKAEQLQPSHASLRIGQSEYRAATRNVIRHNAGLALMLGRPRTAAAIAQRLIAEEPDNANNYALLGDAYRTLGARTPIPDDGEQTDEAKNEARKRMRKMTVTEYDKALLADPKGEERWEANAVLSEETYHKALAMDPNNANAHRGLGFLYEKKGQRAAAGDEFKRYLELSPEAKDGRQIRLHMELLEKAAAPAATGAATAEHN